MKNLAWALLCLLITIAVPAGAQTLLAQVPRHRDVRDGQDSFRIQYRDGHWEPWKADGYLKETTGVWSDFYDSPNDATYAKLDLKSRVQLATSWLMHSEVPQWAKTPNQNPGDQWLEEQRRSFGARFFHDLSALDQSVIAEGALQYLLSMLSSSLEPEITTDRAVEIADRFIRVARRNPYNDLRVGFCNSAGMLEPNPQDGRLSPYLTLTREFLQKIATRSSANSGFAEVTSYSCRTYQENPPTVASLLKASLKLETSPPPEFDLQRERESKGTAPRTFNVAPPPDLGVRCPAVVIQQYVRSAIEKFEEYPKQSFSQHVNATEEIPDDPNRLKCVLNFKMSRFARATVNKKAVYQLQRYGELNFPVGKPIRFSSEQEAASQF